MPTARDILKCQLRPQQRRDYRVEFSDDLWSRLQKAFPEGVCDWTQRGFGQQLNVPWLTYADGSGGKPLGKPPRPTKLRRPRKQ